MSWYPQFVYYFDGTSDNDTPDGDYDSTDSNDNDNDNQERDDNNDDNYDNDTNNDQDNNYDNTYDDRCGQQQYSRQCIFTELETTAGHTSRMGGKLSIAGSNFIQLIRQILNLKTWLNYVSHFYENINIYVRIHIFSPCLSQKQKHFSQLWQ